MECNVAWRGKESEQGDEFQRYAVRGHRWDSLRQEDFQGRLSLRSEFVFLLAMLFLVIIRRLAQDDSKKVTASRNDKKGVGFQAKESPPAPAHLRGTSHAIESSAIKLQAGRTRL
jgi:hypothetical protein